MEEISAYFGVKYYEFANPAFPIPSKSELRKNIKEYLKANDFDSNYVDQETAPGYARNMDVYLASGKLAEPKTSYQIAADYTEMFSETILPSKVTDILKRNPRKKLVDISKSDGGKSNLYRLKNSK